MASLPLSAVNLLALFTFCSAWSFLVASLPLSTVNLSRLFTFCSAWSFLMASLPLSSVNLLLLFCFRLFSFSLMVSWPLSLINLALLFNFFLLPTSNLKPSLYDFSWLVNSSVSILSVEMWHFLVAMWFTILWKTTWQKGHFNFSFSKLSKMIGSPLCTYMKSSCVSSVLLLSSVNEPSEFVSCFILVKL